MSHYGFLFARAIKKMVQFSLYIVSWDSKSYDNVDFVKSFIEILVSVKKIKFSFNDKIQLYRRRNLILVSNIRIKLQSIDINDKISISIEANKVSQTFEGIYDSNSNLYKIGEFKTDITQNESELLQFNSSTFSIALKRNSEIVDAIKMPLIKILCAPPDIKMKFLDTDATFICSLAIEEKRDFMISIKSIGCINSLDIAPTLFLKISSPLISKEISVESDKFNEDLIWTNIQPIKLSQCSLEQYRSLSLNCEIRDDFDKLIGTFALNIPELHGKHPQSDITDNMSIKTTLKKRPLKFEVNIKLSNNFIVCPLKSGTLVSIYSVENLKDEKFIGLHQLYLKTKIKSCNKHIPFEIPNRIRKKLEETQNKGWKEKEDKIGPYYKNSIGGQTVRIRGTTPFLYVEIFDTLICGATFTQDSELKWHIETLMPGLQFHSIGILGKYQYIVEINGHECTGKTKKEFDHIINTQEKRKIFLLYDPYFVVGDLLIYSEPYIKNEENKNVKQILPKRAKINILDNSEKIITKEEKKKLRDSQVASLSDLLHMKCPHCSIIYVLDSIPTVFNCPSCRYIFLTSECFFVSKSDL